MRKITSRLLTDPSRFARDVAAATAPRGCTTLPSLPAPRSPGSVLQRLNQELPFPFEVQRSFLAPALSARFVMLALSFPQQEQLTSASTPASGLRLEGKLLPFPVRTARRLSPQHLTQFSPSLVTQRIFPACTLGKGALVCNFMGYKDHKEKLFASQSSD